MGLYARPLHAIREYVQNEVDVEPRPSDVKIRVEADRVSIWGNGKGMDENDIEIAKKVGVSDKNPTEHTGFRGIGIWSGVAIADEILIGTKKRDCPKAYYLRINGHGIRKEIHSNISLKRLLEENVSLSASKDRPLEQHFTHVELKRIIPEVRTSEMWSESQMKRYIAEVLPIGLDPNWTYSEEIEKKLRENVPDYRVFHVEFNGKPVFRPPYNKNLEPPKFDFLFNDKRKRIGYWWFCINKDRGVLDEETDFPRLVLKKKAFTVGDRRSCVGLFTGGERLLSWTTGEIHVIDSNIVPDSQRMDFESSVEKEVFMKAVKDQLATRLEEDVRRKSYRENLAEAILEIERLSVQPVKAKTGQEKLEKLKQLDTLEGKLLNYKPEWTSDELKRQRNAKLNVVRNLKARISRLRPSTMVALPISKELSEAEEISIPESEVSLIEIANKFSLKHQSKVIMEVVETALACVKDESLRVQIKNAIVEELTRILRVK
jgi:hypothetical protein